MTGIARVSMAVEQTASLLDRWRQAKKRQTGDL